MRLFLIRSYDHHPSEGSSNLLSHATSNKRQVRNQQEIILTSDIHLMPQRNHPHPSGGSIKVFNRYNITTEVYTEDLKPSIDDHHMPPFHQMI